MEDERKNCPRCGMLSNRSIAALRFLYLDGFSFFFLQPEDDSPPMVPVYMIFDTRREIIILI